MTQTEFDLYVKLAFNIAFAGAAFVAALYALWVWAKVSNGAR